MARDVRLAEALRRVALLPESEPLRIAAVERVTAMRAASETPQEFAAALGCSPRVGQRVLRAYGLPGYIERRSPYVRVGVSRPASAPRIVRQPRDPKPAVEEPAHPPASWCSCPSCLRARGRAA